MTVARAFGALSPRLPVSGIRPSTLVLGLAVCATGVLKGQCPDGTPPPCAAPAPRARPGENSLAVLYFDNVSRDSDDVYLADGLTEELISRLGEVPRLAVKSRFVSRRFRGRTITDPAAMGREAGAAYLVTGSVRRAGNRVRVTAELVRTATGDRVWGATLDQESSDVLAIEEQIAQEVATGVAGRLLPAERATLARRPTRVPEAYDLYLQGLHWQQVVSEAGQRRAVELYTRAIARDSQFALAYAGLAEAWSDLADSWVAPRDAYARATEAGQRAIALDSTLPEAWNALEQPIAALTYNLVRSEELTRRALALDPRNVYALEWLGLLRLSGGRTDEALATLRRAWALDTLSLYGAFPLAQGLAILERGSELQPLLARFAAALSPEDLRQLEGVVRLGQGDCAAASQRLDWRYIGGWPPGQAVASLVCAGRRDAARAVVDSMVAATRGPGYYNPMAVAAGYVVLGDTAQAYRWLERAYDERTYWFMFLPVCKVFAPLRGDAHFADLVGRLRMGS